MVMVHLTRRISAQLENGLKQMVQIGGLMIAHNGPILMEMVLEITLQMERQIQINSLTSLLQLMIQITMAIPTIGLHLKMVQITKDYSWTTVL